MELFNADKEQNLLPYDGTVNYYGQVLTDAEALHYYNRLMEGIEWKNDEAVMFGKHIITKRKVAWYADAGYSYTYSNTTKHALPWTPELLELKTITGRVTGTQFNSCLLNLYHSGNEGMAWHSDDEKALAKDSAIGSFSFGAVRKFCFKHKQTKELVCLHLDSGSLLVMKDATQTNWWHRLPLTKKVTTPRINLTFRTMDTQPPKGT